MKKIIALTIVFCLASMSQPVQAATPNSFQDIGIEFKTSTKDVTATVQALEYRATKWGHTLALVWVFDNYSRKKIQVKGTFSLHFQSGSPISLPKRYFSDMTIQPRKTEASNWTWEFSAQRKPIYVQWNPSKSIVKPSVKTLRWLVPEFDSAITAWD